MSYDRDRRDRSNDDSERNERTRRARVQAQAARGARPHHHLSSVRQPSPEHAAILDQMILRRGLADVQELGERGELPRGCNTPTGEQVRDARVRSSWKAGVELDTPSAMRSVQAQAESDLVGETATPEVVRRVISQPGKPLEGAVREEMEARMGDSFSDVQLHTGPEAAKAASALEARAFTTGNHVVFNRGEYDPESAEGKYLLAHELAHVRQQTGGQVSMLPQEGSSLVIDPDPALEHEADEVAKRALEGEAADPVVAHRLGMDVAIQRTSDIGRREFVFGGGITDADEEDIPEVSVSSVLKAGVMQFAQQRIPGIAEANAMSEELHSQLGGTRQLINDLDEHPPPPSWTDAIAGAVLDRLELGGAETGTGSSQASELGR
ncbi:eCIS core domain-containing protein [Natronobiforma cellulositropha]|uniref:eCIS core domain-containing protein n=1 Tax=Natronobiforma cellulositropha TaxID=1679076 RepID=UPI0021D5986A|nr:DUF4157 domain-containing protein [Natronobiforma cellulositropha]